MEEILPALRQTAGRISARYRCHRPTPAPQQIGTHRARAHAMAAQSPAGMTSRAMRMSKLVARMNSGTSARIAAVQARRAASMRRPASRMAPNAPAEADSVGVATPVSTEPSTATIKSSGGTRARPTCSQSGSWSPLSRSARDRAGDACGRSWP